MFKGCDAKLTVDGRSFHTFTTLSAKKSTANRAVRPWFVQFVHMTAGLLNMAKLKKTEKARKVDRYQVKNNIVTKYQV